MNRRAFVSGAFGSSLLAVAGTASAMTTETSLDSVYNIRDYGARSIVAPISRAESDETTPSPQPITASCRDPTQLQPNQNGRNRRVGLIVSPGLSTDVRPHRQPAER